MPFLEHLFGALFLSYFNIILEYIILKQDILEELKKHTKLLREIREKE